MLPTGQGGGASHQRGRNAFPRPQGGCTVFAAKGGIKMAPERALTSPAGTVSQPIGKPFNGQAKGLLWLTWRSYAGPPQYFIPPEGGALNPPVRRSRSQAEPWQPRADRPGGCLNPHARKGVSTYGNTGKRRPGPGPDPDRAERRLNPYAPKGVSHFPLSSFLCYNIGKFEPQSFLQGGLTYGKDSCCIRSSAAGSVAG